MTKVNSTCFSGYYQIARNVLVCALPDLKFKKIILYHQIYLAPEQKEIQNKPNPFTNTTTLTKLAQHDMSTAEKKTKRR